MEFIKKEHADVVDRLSKVLSHLKTTFVDKDEIIDLMGICLVGRENLFMLGPPGTAKSAMVREMANLSPSTLRKTYTLLAIFFSPSPF